MACTLDRDALEARLAEWEALRREALVSASRDGAVGTTVWRAGGSTFERLASLVDAERSCCSFFTFDLHRGSDEIRLIVTAPPGAEGALDVFG